MLPALIAAGSLAARAAPWLLALGPLVAEFFSGKGNDEQAAAKISAARDGLAARLAAAEGISIDKATAAVNEQLQPLIQQHAQDAGASGGALASGVAAAVGGALIGRGMGKAAGAVGKLAKGAMVAEEAAPAPAVAAEAQAAGGMLAHGAQSPSQAAAIEGVRDVGRLDSQIMASKRQGLPVISGKQEQALGGVIDENRMTRRFDPMDEVPTAGQRGAAEDIGLRGKFGNEDMIPELDQRAAVEDMGGEQRWRNMLAREQGGMDDLEQQFKAQQMMKLLGRGGGYSAY